MGLHDGKFFFIKFTGLIKHGIGDSYLSYIMKRSRTLAVTYKTFRNLILIIPELQHLPSYDAHICSCLTYMIACGFISVLHHIRKGYQQAALHRLYLLGILFAFLKIPGALICCFYESPVKLLYLIACAYIKLGELS